MPLFYTVQPAEIEDVVRTSSADIGDVFVSSIRSGGSAVVLIAPRASALGRWLETTEKGRAASRAPSMDDATLSVGGQTLMAGDLLSRPAPSVKERPIPAQKAHVIDRTAVSTGELPAPAAAEPVGTAAAPPFADAPVVAVVAEA